MFSQACDCMTSLSWRAGDPERSKTLRFHMKYMYSLITQHRTKYKTHRNNKEFPFEYSHVGIVFRSRSPKVRKLLEKYHRFCRTRFHHCQTVLIPNEILTCMDCVTIASCKSNEIMLEILVIMVDLIAYFTNHRNSNENQTIVGSLAKRVLQNKKTKMHTKYECFCPTRFHHLENS